VRLHLAVDGGFAAVPGLRRPLDVDLEQLPVDQAQQILGLLQATGFFELPDTLEPPSAGAADYREYTITADDGQRCHTVKVPELAAPPMLLDLIDRLRSLSS
jgi:hypothetical protein